jgi:serine phosphatase RsbU (regulator of sigma subunit)
MVPFTMSSIQLHPKDIIYTYSDGFTDQLGGEKKKKFSKANFFKILERISGNDLLVQKVMLDNEFEKWKGSLEQLDDVVVFSVMID